MSDSKRTVGIDDVVRALQIREGGGSWAQVIEATGFNGATLRPHITKFLASKERLGRPPVQKGDRVDSPYAVVQPVSVTAEDIVAARKAGMAWYSIANATGISEAKCRALGGAEASPRVYRKPAEVKPAPAKAAKPVAKAKPAAAKTRRAAKKAA